MTRWLPIGLSLTAYAISLLLPAMTLHYKASGATEEVPGWSVFAMGWLGTMVGCMAWLANPAFALGLYYLEVRRPDRARWALAVAWILGLSTVIHLIVPVQDPHDSFLIQLRVGYFVWMGSLTIAAAFAWLQSPAGSGSNRAAEAKAATEQAAL